MKIALAILTLALGALPARVHAESWRALFSPRTERFYNYGREFATIECFPHQIAVSDLICTGTVLSTNDGRSAEFAVDEILWGYAASSNITLRPVSPYGNPGLSYLHQGRYLILAFTNNWWMGNEDSDFFEDLSIHYLHDYITPTSRPPTHAVFDDYRLLSQCGGAISFDDIIVGGTNYWEGTKDFITNMLDIARVHQDERRAYEWFFKLHYETNATPVRKRLPPRVWHGIKGYMWWRYDEHGLPSPDNLPPRGQVKEPPYKDFVPPDGIE